MFQEVIFCTLALEGEKNPRRGRRADLVKRGRELEGGKHNRCKTG